MVATHRSQLAALDELERRGHANGLTGLERLGPDRIRDHEPQATGVGALLVPEAGVVDAVQRAARGVTGVLGTEKLKIRRSGSRYLLELHVQADPALSLRDAHILGGTVRTAIRSGVPAVGDVLVHMEPFESSRP